MGRGIALVLAKEEGCRVYATARDGEALQALSKEVSETDGEGSVVPCVLDQKDDQAVEAFVKDFSCLLYTSPSPRDISGSRMPSSA